MSNHPNPTPSRQPSPAACDDLLYSQFFTAKEELYQLGFIVDHHPSSRNADWTLKISDGQQELVSVQGADAVFSHDTVAIMKRMVESCRVEDRLIELRTRLAIVGWKYQIDADHRIHLEKASPANTRTYWPTYDSLQKIERDLLHAEFIQRIQPYRQQLHQFIGAAKRQLEACQVTVLNLCAKYGHDVDPHFVAPDAWRDESKDDISPTPPEDTLSTPSEGDTQPSDAAVLNPIPAD